MLECGEPRGRRAIFSCRRRRVQMAVSARNVARDKQTPFICAPAGFMSAAQSFRTFTAVTNKLRRHRRRTERQRRSGAGSLSGGWINLRAALYIPRNWRIICRKHTWLTNFHYLDRYSCARERRWIFDDHAEFIRVSSLVYFQVTIILPNFTRFSFTARREIQFTRHNRKIRANANSNARFSI